MLKTIATAILKRYLNSQFVKKEIKKVLFKHYKKGAINLKKNRVKSPDLYLELSERLRFVNGFIFKKLVREALVEEGIKLTKSNDAWYFRGLQRRSSQSSLI